MDIAFRQTGRIYKVLQNKGIEFALTAKQTLQGLLLPCYKIIHWFITEPSQKWILNAVCGLCE